MTVEPGVAVAVVALAVTVANSVLMRRDRWSEAIKQARAEAVAVSGEHRRQCEQDLSAFGERLTAAFERVDELRLQREALAERVTRVETEQRGVASGLARVEASAAGLAAQINALAREVSEERGGRPR